eukprot:m.18279 g.18279  ORF g.18279 m.18279 type:complete len:239 (-) comp8284_c0_seq1:115-831(-)
MECKRGVVGLEEEVKGFTLVIPCVSVGNVPQLSTDLLISTLGMEKLDDVRHKSVVPFCGYENETDLCTELGLYVNREKTLLALQIRSDVSKEGREQFVEDLLEWATQLHLGKVIVATSVNAAHCMDQQMDGNKVRMLRTTEDIPLAGFLELEKALDSGLPHDVFLPGGGYARALFLKAMEESNVPLAVLSIFTSPGDNLQQAFIFATALSTVTIGEEATTALKGWRPPSSWEYLLNRV